MARTLGSYSFVTVLLPAATVLLERHSGHRFYKFIGSRESGWRIVPHTAGGEGQRGAEGEDHAALNQLLARQRFRAFMSLEQLACFRDPVVDCENGKLIIRSGKRKITPLE